MKSEPSCIMDGNTDPDEPDPEVLQEEYENSLSLSYKLIRKIFQLMKVKYKEFVVNPADPTEVTEAYFPFGYKLQEFFGSVELKKNTKRIGYYGDGWIYQFLLRLLDIARQMELEKCQFDPMGGPKSYE